MFQDSDLADLQPLCHGVDARDAVRRSRKPPGSVSSPRTSRHHSGVTRESSHLDGGHRPQAARDESELRQGSVRSTRWSR